MKQDPGMSRKALKMVARRQIAEEEHQARRSELQSLPRQGHLSRLATTSEAATVWADVVNGLPEEQFKFALNAAHDTLPHNANLHLWGKKERNTCPLCLEDSQNLVHVLNSCRVARDLRRYNDRHDSVLAPIYQCIREHLPHTASVSADLGSDYTFPHHIVATDLRPDIIMWDDSTMEVCMVELSVCFDSLFHDAAQRKESRYCELLASFTQSGCRAELITLEVGSRGLPHMAGFLKLGKRFGLSRREVKELLTEVGRLAISGSFRIWCSRNRNISVPIT